MELIAFLVPVARHPWYQTISKSDGLVDFCAQTGDLIADVAAFRRAGISINDRNAMSRDRPDGYRVKWDLSIPNAPFNGSVPFLIQDETPRDERMPRERNHRNGVTGLANLMIAMTDTAKTAGWYRVITGEDGKTSSIGSLMRRERDFRSEAINWRLCRRADRTDRSPNFSARGVRAAYIKPR